MILPRILAWALICSAVACKKAPSLASETSGSGSAVDQAPPAEPPSEARVAPAPLSAGLAFPGAEGFGAHARGGHGGSVCIVRSLAKAGPGSLAACLAATGRRTVVFQVAGVIEGPLEIAHGGLTIAGESAPGPVVVKGGMVCDNVYDPNDCNDVVVRHVRFRGGAPDSFRIGGAHDVILDHCSFAGAEDENIEITRSRDVTVQFSVVAEPVGEHYKWGGVLINYSKDVMPLDRIAIHHTVWNGVAGRLPEVSCEENGDGPGRSNCAGHVLHMELTNNLLWDVSDPIWYNRCVGTNEGNDCPASTPAAKAFRVELNAASNLVARRSSSVVDPILFEPHLLEGAGNRVFAAGNRVLVGPSARALTMLGVTARHAFPQITVTPVEGLASELQRRAGAFPRDAMDARLAGYLSQPVDSRPPSWARDQGIDRGDAFAVRPSAMRAEDADRDGDGMPDAWEPAHGAQPGTPDAAQPGRCGADYTRLECWLHERAAALVP